MKNLETLNYATTTFIFPGKFLYFINSLLNYIKQFITLIKSVITKQIFHYLFLKQFFIISCIVYNQLRGNTFIIIIQVILKENFLSFTYNVVVAVVTLTVNYTYIILPHERA